MPFRADAQAAIERLAVAKTEEEFEAARRDLRQALASSYRRIEPMHYKPHDRGKWYGHPRLTPERLARYRNRTQDELAEDLICAFDKMESLKTKVWVLTGAMGVLGGVTTWLADQLMTCLNSAHSVRAALH